MKTKLLSLLPLLLAGACAVADDAPLEQVDPIDECVFCDGRADAFGIARDSYLAYGIVAVANNATLVELDDDVPLDARAARGIVADRPFEYIEQIDTVSYVGKTAFTALARYATDNGYVPFCGDGSIQPILEACDDGNLVDNDGCSAACTIEAGGNLPNYLDDKSDIIRGQAIGVSIVNANGYYLRQRPKNLAATDEIKAILDRADGIEANSTADGKVSWDELAILSKDPFYSSLFSDEKAALKGAWELFEVNSDPVVEVAYKGGVIDRSQPFTPHIERVGPLAVQGTRRIADLESDTQRTVAQRLQQMAGCNADNDSSTIEFADIEKGIADYGPVFTSYENQSLLSMREFMFEGAEASTGGDFMIEFAQQPNSGAVAVDLVEFDGWTFGFTSNLSVNHDAFDTRLSYYSSQPNFDANLRTSFSFNTFLKRNGSTNYYCNSPWELCNSPFRYRGVSFVHLDGTAASGGRETKPMLMEYWSNGKRVYNRMVEFKETYSNYDKTGNYDEFAGARPVVAGQNMSFSKSGTVSYGSKEYTRFKMVPVATAFNRNLKKFFPTSYSTLENRLTPGRYNAFQEVVLEVHDSRNIIAYYNGCEQPMTFNQGVIEATVCGRAVSITFSNIDATLRVNGQEIDIYDSNDIYNGYESRLLGLDKSYYIVE
jgi:cysteine-rich repeat protein